MSPHSLVPCSQGGPGSEAMSLPPHHTTLHYPSLQSCKPTLTCGSLLPSPTHTHTHTHTLHFIYLRKPTLVCATFASLIPPPQHTHFISILRSLQLTLTGHLLLPPTHTHMHRIELAAVLLVSPRNGESKSQFRLPHLAIFGRPAVSVSFCEHV